VLSFTLLSFKVKLDFISKLTSHFKVITQMWQTIFAGPLQATTSILFLFLFFSHLLVAKSLQGPFDRRGQLDYPLIFIFYFLFYYFYYYYYYYYYCHLAKGVARFHFLFFWKKYKKAS
jgi:hypothetical protein